MPHPSGPDDAAQLLAAAAESGSLNDMAARLGCSPYVLRVRTARAGLTVDDLVERFPTDRVAAIVHQSTARIRARSGAAAIARTAKKVAAAEQALQQDTERACLTPTQRSVLQARVTYPTDTIVALGARLGMAPSWYAEVLDRGIAAAANPDTGTGPDVDADLRLAALLDVSPFHVRPLCRRGVTDLEQMATWTYQDLADVDGIGTSRLEVLVPAMRAVGIPLPDRDAG